MEITGTYNSERVRWDETMAVLDVRSGKEWVTVVCPCAAGDLEPNVDYTFSGEYKTHPRYGRQFQANSWVVCTPVSKEATIRFLQKFPGIGSVHAKKIYDIFGMKTLEVLATDKDALKVFRRLTPDDREKIHEGIKQDLEASTMKIELANFLAGAGFPRTLTETIYKRYKLNALKMLRRNPYLLLREEGCGFTSVDRFAIAKGYNPLRLKRQALFLQHFMREESDVWFEAYNVRSRLMSQFGAATKFRKTVELLVRAKKMVIRDDEGQKWVTLKEDDDAEKTIAELALQHLVENLPIYIDFNGLTSSQIAALRTATAQKIGCLVGGPGTGKTYTLARYIKSILTDDEDSVIVLAPTGKAVVRSREMLSSVGIECAAGTIHSFLYGRLASRDFDFVIVDESSMIDHHLMRGLLERTKHSSILFVGDDGQLLPVGKGSPFADILASGKIPVGRLRKTMRNSGKIVEVCHKIRQNQPWKTSENLDLEAGENIIFVETSDFLGATKTIISQWVGKINLIRDMQVIVGINRGQTGRIEMNTRLQAHLNPALVSVGGKYRVNDPVICLKNGNYKDAESGEEDVMLANGEIGYCDDVKKDVFVDFGGGRRVKFSEKHGSFDLAYAVTCHKMQGSETPIAIVFLDPSYQAGMICSREWLYTAISRAKKACYLIGSKTTAETFCRRLGNVRKTFLCEELRK